MKSPTRLLLALAALSSITMAQQKEMRTFTNAQGKSIQGRVLGISGSDGDFRVETELVMTGERRSFRAKKIVIAIGYFDRPNLIGIPGETKDDIEETRRNLRTINSNWFHINCTSPRVGSEIHATSKKFGYIRGETLGADYKVGLGPALRRVI